VSEEEEMGGAVVGKEGGLPVHMDSVQAALTSSGKRKGPIERSSGQAEWFHREDDKEMSVRTCLSTRAPPATPTNFLSKNRIANLLSRF
jgi:hypothetical protein